ncbi:MAG: site-specific integrase [Sideroxydans sp.]
MATFKQRDSGYWQAVIRRKNHPQQSKTFERRDDAEVWARDVENKMDKGVFHDMTEAENTTLKEALGRYEKEVSKHKDGYTQEKIRIRAWKNDSHFKNDSQEVSRSFKLSGRSLASLRGSDFAKWRDRRLDDVSSSTAQKDLAIISHLFTIAADEWGIPIANPIRNVKIKAEDNSRDRIFEKGEEERLLKELTPTAGSRTKLRSIWLTPLVIVAAETAARQSELLALKWSDVNIDAGVIRIKGKARKTRLAATSKKSSAIKSRTKNKDKHRDVPLSPRAIEVLDALPRHISGKVFPVSAQVLRNAFIKAVKRAKIEDFHFHDLRHVGTSKLAEKLSMQELMKSTGHKNSRMLERYYHPKAEDMAKKLAA